MKHTFYREAYTLWADRVPAIHGNVNLFTLWRTTAQGEERLIGGVTSSQLRLFLKDA